MADIKLVLELFDDRLAGSSPASPMNMAHRVAGPIFAQGNEILALADVRCQGNTALLVFHGSREINER